MANLQSHSNLPLHRASMPLDNLIRTTLDSGLRKSSAGQTGAGAAAFWLFYPRRQPHRDAPGYTGISHGWSTCSRARNATRRVRCCRGAGSVFSGRPGRLGLSILEDLSRRAHH